MLTSVPIAVEFGCYMVDWQSKPATLFIGCLILTGGLATAAPVSSVVNGGIKLITPLTPTIAQNSLREIQVDIGAYRGPVVVLLDNSDITAMVEREEGRLLYRPLQPLSLGGHRLQVWALDPAGPGREQWELTITTQGMRSGQREIYSQSSLSLSVNAVAGDGARDHATTAQGNLALDAGLKAGKWNASLQGNFAYSSVQEENQDSLEPNQFLFNLQRDGDSLAFGDVSFAGTALTAPSLARRGTLLTIHQASATYQLAQLGVNSASGWETGIDDHSQIVAGSVSFQAGSGMQPWHISAAILDGENSDPGAAANVATLEAPSRGRVAGVGLKGRLWDTGIDTETGWSEFDADTRDQENGLLDKAATLQLDKNFAGIAWSANFIYAGPNFASLANPRAMRDQQQIGLSAGTGFGSSTLSVSVARSHDNVEGDASKAVVYSDNAGITYALVRADWPAFSLAYMQGTVYSSDEPAGVDSSENQSRTVSATLSYNRKTWFANFAVSQARIEDAVNGDSVSLSQQLTLNFQPSQKWNLAPALALSQSEHAAVIQRTPLLTFSGNWRIGDKASLAGQVSMTRNEADDQSVDNQQESANLRFAWDVSSFMKRWVSGQQSSISLSASHSRSLDALDASHDADDNSVFLGININQSLHGSYRY